MITKIADCVFVFCMFLNGTLCQSRTKNHRIISQSPVAPYDEVNFPHHVNFYMENDMDMTTRFGGTLISENTILTAAHPLVSEHDCQARRHEYVAAAGSFFKDESKDSTRQESLVVEKISHPEYCRVQKGKVQVKLEFDLGLCRTESPFIPSTFSKPLTVVHAVRTYDSKFREYLEREEIYTSGMGMCSEYRFVMASQRGSARLLLATSSENPYRRLVSFYPDGRGKRRAHPYVGDSGSGVVLVRPIGTFPRYSLLGVIQGGEAFPRYKCLLYPAHMASQGTTNATNVADSIKWVEKNSKVKFDTGRGWRRAEEEECLSKALHIWQCQG